MHLTPRAYVQQLSRSWPGGRVLEIGSRDVNGSVRSLFQRRPPTIYHGIDIVDGPGVDQVVHGAQFKADEPFDLVLCLEVFEHTHEWPLLIDAAWRALPSGGLFLFTCAGPARAPHGAAGGLLTPGEWYRNLEIEQLHRALQGWRIAELAYARGELDLIGQAYRP